VIPGSDVLHHKVDGHFARLFRHLLDSVAAFDLPDGSSLLDAGICACFNDNANGPQHCTWDVPWVLAGGAGGALRQGESVDAVPRDADGSRCGRSPAQAPTTLPRLHNTLATALGVRKDNGEPIDNFDAPKLPGGLLSSLTPGAPTGRLPPERPSHSDEWRGGEARSRPDRARLYSPRADARSGRPGRRRVIDLSKADALAYEVHRAQRRVHGAPYVEHPRAVRRFAAHLSAALERPFSDELAAAALLHDVLEDGDGLRREDLEGRFGPRVAQLVAQLSRPVDEDKPGHLRRLATEGDDDARLLKVADRLHNLLELSLILDRERQRAYLEESERLLLPIARGARAAALARGLAAALLEAIALARRQCGLLEAEGSMRAVPTGVYVIIDITPDIDDERVLSLLDAAAAGGAAVLQLRAKGITDRRLLALLEGALPSCRAVGVPLVVNDRADVALVAGADGVHLGTTDLPSLLVRPLLPVGALLGGSSHTLAQARALWEHGGVDYVAFGPVFPSPTKQGHAEVTGEARLAEVSKQSPLSVCAIGGITDPARMAAVARAGASLGAVVSAVASASDPKEATCALGIAFAAARGARMKGPS
jgi:thiamine-phosphate pyrophosphorylase